ncbi:hypothetical protein Sjap_026189 [Stephania japonica]|uniref:Uncharacterized protein n=1 Tax=Stephania japonica TaxID=461633 RepID=A0AAP0EAY0_9MAGN
MLRSKSWALVDFWVFGVDEFHPSFANFFGSIETQEISALKKGFPPRNSRLFDPSRISRLNTLMEPKVCLETASSHSSERDSGNLEVLPDINGESQDTVRYDARGWFFQIDRR